MHFLQTTYFIRHTLDLTKKAFDQLFDKDKAKITSLLKKKEL